MPDDDDIEMALEEHNGGLAMPPPAYSKQPTMAKGQVYVSN